MGGKDFSSVSALERHLNNILKDNEFILDIPQNEDEPDIRFFNLIRSAHRKYGNKVVVLIDEYDKPMLDTHHDDDDLHSGVRRLLRSFYGCIKESAEHIRFVMITGVTKFSHVNIFSGLNNLRDISLNPEYNSLCGISETEMGEYFAEDMNVFANRNGISIPETALQFKIHYDGYRFAAEGENIYNPFSVICAFAEMAFDNYWFASGTSLYLVREMKRSNYDFLSLSDVQVSKSGLLGVNQTPDNVIALLYQAGYLTIKEYSPDTQLYTLGFPNKEVSSGFFNNLLAVTIGNDSGNRFSADKVLGCVQKGDADGMMQLFKYALSQYTYPQIDANATEKHFNLLMYTISMAIGLNVQSEINTTRGRIDMTIETRRFIYILEFKVNSTPKRAIAQIDDKGYTDKYTGDTRTIFKIGANFSKKTRTLTGWIIEKER